MQGTKSASETAEEIVKEAHRYDGFNLILAELRTRTMFYISNRPKGKPIFVQKVPPGVHALSNANLNSPWPKVNVGLLVCCFKINYVLELFPLFYAAISQ